MESIEYEWCGLAYSKIIISALKSSNADMIILATPLVVSRKKFLNRSF